MTLNICTKKQLTQNKTIKICTWHVLLISATLIVIYGTLLKIYKIPKRHDPLTYTIGEPDEYSIYKINGWHLTHFLLYSTLGFLFPENRGRFFFLGIAWEVFEDYTGKLYRRQFGNRWWIGDITDIVANMLGYEVGQFLNRIIYTDMFDKKNSIF